MPLLLVVRLKIEHIGLAALVRKAAALGPEVRAAKALLDEPKKILLKHLVTEMEEILTPLRRAAASNPSLREMLESPEADQALRRATLLFTRQDLTCTEAELVDVQEGLRARFLWEETVLFPAYELLLREL